MRCLSAGGQERVACGVRGVSERERQTHTQRKRKRKRERKGGKEEG
jgi:hypothetical protein